MGAWGPDTFENDAASDWKYDLVEQGEAVVEQALRKVLDADVADLDPNDACCGLAACEVIARWKGNWGTRDASTAALDEWVSNNPRVPSDELVKTALAVIDCVLAPESELAELWEGDDQWQEAISGLRARVEG